MDSDIRKNLDSNLPKVPTTVPYKFEVTNPFSNPLILKFKLFLMKFLTALGLALGLMITTVSETAVSTVSETIGNELKGLGSTIWFSSGYTITAVAFNPLFGKLSDVFGRSNTVCFCNLIFVIGCLGSALAVDIPMLIVFRVITGIGGGGLMAFSYIMVPDAIPLLDRPFFYGIVNISFAVSCIIGPIIGRSIALYSWRIMFYIFIPICAVHCLIVIFIMPLPKSKGNIMTKLKRVDWLGSTSLILCVIGIVLICNWGGKDYSWNSLPIITIICLSTVLFLVFIYIETKVSVEPILPPKMFNRNTIFVNLATFFLGAINFVGITYFPVYYQTVKNYSLPESGYLTIPFLILTGIFCMISGFIARHFNSGREVMWIGGIFQLIAVILLGFISESAPLCQHLGYIVLNGIGVGCIKQLIVMVCQKTSSKKYIATITGFATFSHSIGRVIGLAIIDRVYSNIYTKEITLKLPQLSPQDLALPSVMENLTLNEKGAIIYSNFIAFKYSYLNLIPFSGLCFISLLLLTKWPPIPKSNI